jgi:predicted secreted protein
MTNCADTARRPDEQRLVDIASILAEGILRLRERQSLPVTANDANPTDYSQERLELSSETISVVHVG